MLFSWIRSQARAAVLAGLADAAEYLSRQQDTAPVAESDGEQRLRLLCLPAPEAAEEPQTPARRRKGGE